ncbi:hypothetical protein SAMN04487895_104253 [Paenibacillus sophorae]|uniref:DUF5348 domain-containing protein n=1 Tax=Paenibacillus sophorae TaxID=1333845 RepID=A0A1H8LAC9_9BACL|nr:DUF5348 domain-containing protein [Paenibacillus sophorae]QWU17364.1 DUF5348 domain-containing protein [Paenibacillus sophorae]SEO02041.1 hypothetical protein SAMN04487895_104253 [Paenibacillus sophorae]
MKDQIQAELQKLMPQFKRVTKMIQEAEDSWTAHYDRTNPDDMYLRDIFNVVGDKLGDVEQLLRVAAAPVAEEGILRKGKNGRYSLNGSEFTTGQSIEYLDAGYDGYDPRWVYSRIEHNGTDYYIVRSPKLLLNGLKVRIKRISRWD